GLDIALSLLQAVSIIGGQSGSGDKPPGVIRDRSVLLCGCLHHLFTPRRIPLTGPWRSVTVSTLGFPLLRCRVTLELYHQPPACFHLPVVLHELANPRLRRDQQLAIEHACCVAYVLRSGFLQVPQELTERDLPVALRQDRPRIAVDVLHVCGNPCYWLN